MPTVFLSEFTGLSHSVVESFKTMKDFGSKVWVVIGKAWQKKMFGVEVKKERKNRPGEDLTNWLWQEINLLTH